MDNIIGEVTLKWKGNILYADVIGPFNENGVKSAINNYSKLFDERGGVPFYLIVRWNTETLASLDLLPDLQNSWEKLEHYGCIAFALVTSRDIQNWLAEKVLPRIGKIFSEVKDAEQWISSFKKT